VKGAARIAGDGVGVDISKAAKSIGAVTKAFKKRKAKAKFSRSKAPATAKEKPTLKMAEPTYEPTKVDRKTFADQLKAQGGDLRKIKMKMK
jgi:isocitrate/isopropylmalate dehydrogenase